MSAGTKHRMVAIEFSPKEIRAVEFVPNSNPVQVTRAASAERPGGEPSAVAQFLREFLESNGFAAKRALVSYSGPVIEHRIYAIPPVGAENREELLRGKVAQEVSTPVGELRVTGELLGKVVEAGVERQEVLTVFTPEFEIRRLTFLLVEAGLSPARVASVPLALAALHPPESRALLAGFLHVESGRGVIGVSDGGKLRFSREFPLEMAQRAPAAAPAMPEYGNLDLGGGAGLAADPQPSEDEATAERLVTELTRSLLYYRQLSRGGTITRIFWSGMPPSAAAERLIGERLKIEIAPHPAAALSVPGEGVAFDPAEFGVPVGMALAMQVPEQINLLPEGYLRRRKRRKSYTRAVVLAALFLALNVAVFLGLRNAQVRYRQVLADSAVASGGMTELQQEFGRWSALRKAVEEADAQEKRLATPFTRWNALFAALGASAPREVSFSSLALDRSEEGGFRGVLQGVARGKDPAEVQARLNAFLSAVAGRGALPGLAYSPVELRPLRKDEGKGYLQEFSITFSLAREG